MKKLILVVVGLISIASIFCACDTMTKVVETTDEAIPGTTGVEEEITTITSNSLDSTTNETSDETTNETSDETTNETSDEVTSETSKHENEQETPPADVKYVTRSADWPWYSDRTALLDRANVVFVGKVTDIQFEVLDARNALPVTNSTPNHARELYTIYVVEVSAVYKGNVATVSRVRIMGGMREYQTDRQTEIMENGKAYNREYGIPIWEDDETVRCEIGKSYLFALHQFETGDPTILNLEQSIYDLCDPTALQMNISARDIVSAFGADKLQQFDNKWNESEYR